MIHSTAQKRWGEVASCAYRVGVELSEAHCAGFNEDVRDCSVPSSAGYMILVGEGRCCGVGGWMCVWKRRLRCEKRGIIKSAQLRGGDGERTNSAAIQSVLALVPEYLHSHLSLSRSVHARRRQALPRSLQRLGGNIEPPAIDGDNDTSQGRAHHVACLS